MSLDLIQSFLASVPIADSFYERAVSTEFLCDQLVTGFTILEFDTRDAYDIKFILSAFDFNGEIDWPLSFEFKRDLKGFYDNFDCRFFF